MSEGKLGVPNCIADPRVEIKFLSSANAIIHDVRLDLWPNEIHMVLTISYDHEQRPQAPGTIPRIARTRGIHFEFGGENPLAELYEAYESWGISTRLGQGFDPQSLTGRKCVISFLGEGPKSISFPTASS